MATLTIGRSGAEMGTFRSLVCMSDAIEKNVLDLNLLKRRHESNRMRITCAQYMEPR